MTAPTTLAPAEAFARLAQLRAAVEAIRPLGTMPYRSAYARLMHLSVRLDQPDDPTAAREASALCVALARAVEEAVG